MDEHRVDGPKPEESLSQKVGAKAARKLRARRHARRTAWFGLGMMGLIGWSVVIPTLLGALLGAWLDSRLQDSHSWTLTLLIVGVVLGCWIAWRWVAREGKAMRDEQKNNNDKEGKHE